MSYSRSFCDRTASIPYTGLQWAFGADTCLCPSQRMSLPDGISERHWKVETPSGEDSTLASERDAIALHVQLLSYRRERQRSWHQAGCVCCQGHKYRKLSRYYLSLQDDVASALDGRGDAEPQILSWGLFPDALVSCVVNSLSRSLVPNVGLGLLVHDGTDRSR